MTKKRRVFNPPPGWRPPSEDWTPPPRWSPPPDWPEPPPGWELWVELADEEGECPDSGGSSAAAPSISDSHSRPIEDELRMLRSENVALRQLVQRRGEACEELIVLDDHEVLQAIGVYRYHHPLEDAVAYRDRLKVLTAEIVRLAQAGEAIDSARDFQLDGSVSKGGRLIRDLSKLMLNAYNAVVDNCIRSLRAGNSITAIARIDRMRDKISKLGSLMQLEISEQFHALRVEEIELSSDFLMKKKEEREAAKEERARLREEARVEKELEAERAQLEKEKAHLDAALAVLEARGEVDFDLQSRREQIDEAIRENDYRKANIRAGYVYVISNRGAFGRGVVKIGLTRRLDPEDRVRELSGASVPFRFDVHALFFSEDAVTLEAKLHRRFANHRVNMANSRKEFFFASPEDVECALREEIGALLEFKEVVDCEEYLQSLSSWPDWARTRAADSR